MKKTKTTISLIISGMLFSPFGWANNQNSATQPQQPQRSYQERLADIQRLEREAEQQYQNCTQNAQSPEQAVGCDTDRRAAQAHIDEQARQTQVLSSEQARHRGTTQAEAAVNAASDAECASIAIAIAESIKNFPGNVGTKKGDDSYNGSNTFKRCSQNSHLDWAEVVRSDDSTIWNLGWQNFAEKVAKNFRESAGSCADLSSALNSLPGAVKDFTDELINCEAIRSITAKSDFNDAKQIIGGKQATQASLDQKIKCESRGAETRDYKACVKTLNFYNGALVGTTVFTQVQELGYQGHTIENSVLDPNDPTAGLKSQKKDIEKRAGMTQTRAGLDMAKGAALLALWQSIPTAQDVTKECAAGTANRSRVINNNYEAFSTRINTGLIEAVYSPAPDVSAAAKQAQQYILTNAGNRVQPNAIAKSCGNQVSGQFVILNGGARDSIKEAMILAGIDGIKHQTAASLLKKQANEVGKVINEVDNFNPTGLEYFGEEFSGSECALNPAAEGCDDFVNRRSFGFGSNAPIQIHGMENASNFGRNNEAANPTSRDSETSPVDRSDAPKPIGIFDPAAENPSGILDPQGAASVSNDGAGAGGASGGNSGGGVAGGGSPPPPPGGAPNSQAPRMGLPNAGNSNLAYSRGTGAIRAGGGRGAQGRRGVEGDGSENPFAGLFGKENPEGANLNFRGSASEEGEINSPDTSIFQIISDRYIAVHGNDRLLMYEAQEEQGPLQ